MEVHDEETGVPGASGYHRTSKFSTYPVAVENGETHSVAVVEGSGGYYLVFLRISGGTDGYAVGPLSEAEAENYLYEESIGERSYWVGYGYAVLCNGTRLLVYSYSEDTAWSYGYDWMRPPARLALFRWSDRVYAAMLSETTMGSIVLFIIDVGAGSVARQYDIGNMTDIAYPNVATSVIDDEPYLLVAGRNDVLVIKPFSGVEAVYSLMYGTGVYAELMESLPSLYVLAAAAVEDGRVVLNLYVNRAGCGDNQRQRVRRPSACGEHLWPRCTRMGCGLYAEQ